ncbi:hypothetical protein BHM03_00024236 [Ensete ventricosum]|nr:hypothetical protein BHM03_00024236 [Ensete ventricosum]
MPRRCHTTVAKPSPTSVVSSRCHLPICRLQPHPLVRTRVSALCRCYRCPHQPPSARLPCCSHCYCRRYLFLPATAHWRIALIAGCCLLLSAAHRHCPQPLHRSSQPLNSAQPSLPTAPSTAVQPLPLQQPLLYLPLLPSSSSITA